MCDTEKVQLSPGCRDRTDSNHLKRCNGIKVNGSTHKGDISL